MKTLHPIRPTFLFVLIILFCISCAKEKTDTNQTTEEKLPKLVVGKKAPEYIFKKVLNSDANTRSITSEKPIIIELWATWCGACLPALKKLDSLQQQYKGEVDIITVAPDEQARLEKYITNTETKLAIAMDTNFFKVAQISSIPHAVLINKNGIVEAITSPSNINSKLIDQLIAGKPLALFEEEEEESYSESIVIKKVIDKNKQIELRTYDSEARQHGQNKKNSYVFTNYTLPMIFQRIFEIPSYYRITFKDGLSEPDFDYSDPNNRYVLTAEVSPELEGKLNEVVIDFMNNNLDIYAQRAVNSLYCHVLTVSKDILKESTSSEEHFEFRGDYYLSKKQKLDKLVLYIENMQGILVADQTGLEGLYDIEFDWNFEKPETIHKELAKYGLELKKAEQKQPIDILEIRKKDQS